MNRSVPPTKGTYEWQTDVARNPGRRTIGGAVRVGYVAARFYLTDEAIRGLAESMVVDFAEETPGADLLDAPRDSTITVQLAGRATAGMAEAVRVRLAERDDLDHVRELVTQLAQTQASLGLIMADQTGPVANGEPSIRVPRGLLHRIARHLEGAADLIEDGVTNISTHPSDTRSLPDTFRRDAELLRSAATGEP